MRIFKTNGISFNLINLKGLPYPTQVTGAADAVMQYAVRSLGFKEENIILFSWSIGGFAVSWLSSVYPQVKSVVNIKY